MYAFLKGWPQRMVFGLLFFGTLLGRPCLAGLAPIIVLPPLSQTVSYQGSATFSVVASSLTTMTYQWLKDGTSIAGATGSSYTINNAHATDAGVYAVKVTNGGGSVTSSGATLTVLGPPEITTQPASHAVVQGQNSSFSVAASGTAPLDYQWSFNGATLAGATSSALTFTNVQTTGAGGYSVVVANAYGSTTSTVATLTVQVPPGITTQPQSQVVTQGQNVSFSVVASGTAPFHYRWSLNGSQLGPDNSTLTINNVGTNNSGNYAVVVNNSWGSVTSAVATLTVNVPAGIATQPQSQVVTQGQNVSFSVLASGTAPFHYHWSLNGLQLGPDNSILTINNVGTPNLGDYVVVVNNSWGSATSAVATLTWMNPVVTLSVPASKGMSSNGFTFQLSVPVGRTFVILASTDFQAWTPIATNVADTASVTFTDTAAANYRSRFYRAMLR